jgi:hypothetical protein
MNKIEFKPIGELAIITYQGEKNKYSIFPAGYRYWTLYLNGHAVKTRCLMSTIISLVREYERG